MKTVERLPGIDALLPLVTGRSANLLAADMAARHAALTEAFTGARILVIGGAGSVGASTVRELCGFAPASVAVIDLNENTLVELVRDLRASGVANNVRELTADPIDFGSPVMERFLKTQKPFDFVFNFAALKHVRSEKNVYSILQMLDTNLLKAARLLGWLAQWHSTCRFFAVSTDKAANPSSLMGASKRLMEHLILSGAVPSPPSANVTTARFANVAFSAGSLLEGFLQRHAKRQPIAVPENTARYFITPRESGQICVLTPVCAPGGHVTVPKLDATRDSRSLQDIACRMVESWGYTPRTYHDEGAARDAFAADVDSGAYPVVITKGDTTGEKPEEMFIADGETAVEIGLESLLAVRSPIAHPAAVARFIAQVEQYRDQVDRAVSKADLVAMIQELVPELRHVETGKNLDQRL